MPKTVTVHERGTEWGLTPDARIRDLEQQVAYLKRQLVDTQKALRRMSKFAEALDRLLARCEIIQKCKRTDDCAVAVEQMRPQVRAIREKYHLPIPK